MVPRPVYRFHEFELDPARRCLRRGPDEIHVRQKVFDVLLVLIDNRDRVVSRDELLERIWPDTSVTDDTVFGCIVDLRTALGDDRRAPRFIKTVSKAGYRFIAPAKEVSAEPLPEPVAPPVPVRARGRFVFLALTAALLVPGVVYLAAFGTARRTDAAREVGWWRFDEGAGAAVRDATGNGNDAAVLGRATWVEGRRGKALRFDGGGHLEGQDSRRLFPRGAAPRTVTSWMRAPAAAPEDISLFFYGSQGYPLTRRFGFYLDETGKSALGAGSRFVDALRSSTGLSDGGWHFLAAVYEGAATNWGRLYVDGVLQASRTLELPLDTSDDPKWMAGISPGSATRFRGDLDDTRLFARALRTGEVQALYQCAGASDLVLPDGKPAFFLPIFGDRQRETLVELLRPPGASTGVRHLGEDYGGIQFARADADCSMASIRGADAGQDLYIAADIAVPRGPGESITFAGPYFRNRSAVPGDGILGGASAGYWVVLDSNGRVRVRLVEPPEVVAHSAPIAGFDAAQFHRLEIAALSPALEVAVDGAAVEFEQNNVRTAAVSIPPVWEKAAKPGKNQGAAGFAFGSHPRGSAGGQELRNLIVTGHRKLGTARP